MNTISGILHWFITGLTEQVTADLQEIEAAKSRRFFFPLQHPVPPRQKLMPTVPTNQL